MDCSVNWNWLQVNENSWLKTVDNKAAEITVNIKDNNKNLIPLRICAKKKTKEEIAMEEKRLKKLESKKQIPLCAPTLGKLTKLLSGNFTFFNRSIFRQF